MNQNSNQRALTKALVFVPLIFTHVTTSASQVNLQTEHKINAKFNIGWQNDDMANPERDFVSNTSRVNFIGQIGMSDSLAFVYHYGTYMNLADQPNRSFFGDHNQYIGLKTNYGELLYGRYDTMLKQSTYGIDKFNDYVIDVKKLWKGENRIDDSFWFKSKSFNNFKFGLTYMPDSDAAGNDGKSFSLSYGDNKLKKTDLYVSVGIDRNLKGYDIERITAKFDFNGFNIGAGIQHQQHNNSGASDSGLLFNFAYPFKIKENNMSIDFQMQNLDSDRATTIGLNYFYQGKNKIYLWYSDVNKHYINNLGNSSGIDNRIFSIGFEHKFDHRF